MSILEAIKADNYKMGNCQALLYDRRDTARFPSGFLGELYQSLRGDRYDSRRSGSGILDTLFCGMMDTSFDAIVSYLANRPLCVLVLWNPEETKMDVVGLAFPTVVLGGGDQKACFAGYGFIPKVWGSEQQETLAMLGLALIFQEWDVLSVHGIRYATNELTARFMARFGFREVGTIPDYMLKKGKLVEGVISTLSRPTFEAYVERKVLEVFGGRRHLQGDKSNQR